MDTYSNILYVKELKTELSYLAHNAVRLQQTTHARHTTRTRHTTRRAWRTTSRGSAVDGTAHRTHLSHRTHVPSCFGTRSSPGACGTLGNLGTRSARSARTSLGTVGARGTLGTRVRIGPSGAQRQVPAGDVLHHRKLLLPQGTQRPSVRHRAAPCAANETVPGRAGCGACTQRSLLRLIGRGPQL
jgi:hypothetical protein